MTETSTVRDDASRSLISGVALMLLVGTGGAWALGLDDWRTVALVGASAFSCGFFGVWALLLGLRLPRQERVMPTPEQRAAFAAEIGAVPRSAPRVQERIIPVIARGANPETIQRNERQERFVAFVRACARSTASRDLLGMFALEEISEFREVLMRMGFAAWRGNEPRLGWRLLLTADEIVRRLHM